MKSSLKYWSLLLKNKYLYPIIKFFFYVPLRFVIIYISWQIHSSVFYLWFCYYEWGHFSYMVCVCVCVCVYVCVCVCVCMYF